MAPRAQQADRRAPRTKPRRPPGTGRTALTGSAPKCPRASLLGPPVLAQEPATTYQYEGLAPELFLGAHRSEFVPRPSHRAPSQEPASSRPSEEFPNSPLVPRRTQGRGSLKIDGR